jgi:Flp pilus assembly pilin Flp
MKNFMNKEFVRQLKSRLTGMHFSKKVLKDQSGQGMMEYILLLVIVVGLVFMFKGTITGKFNEIKGTLEGKIGETLSN